VDILERAVEALAEDAMLMKTLTGEKDETTVTLIH
jgi:hypothetical protein